MSARRPNPVRFASFVPRRTANPFIYVFAAVIAFGAWFVVESRAGQLTHPAYSEMMRAAETMRAAMSVVRAEKIELGILQPIDIDPNRTALIGSDFTAMTTTLGALDAKRTATNPDLAAALVRLLAELDLSPDARIGIAASGSLVGANIAAIAAVEALGMEVVLVSSVGASMFGATDPEMTWLDIEKLLREQRVINARSRVAVIGGGSAVGNGLDPSGRTAIIEAFRRTGTEMVEVEPLADLIAAVEAALLETGPIDLLINVGGSVIALGDCAEGDRVPTGLSHQVFPCTGIPGLLVEFSRAEVPTVHLLNMRLLAADLGLPYDPLPLPTPGDNRRIYGGATITTD